MSNKNIYNKFKLVLGEYCTMSQFVELSKRSFLTEHSSLLSNKDEFIKLAHNNLITLTCYDTQRISHLISLSYIVNTYVCFETFLKELYNQIKNFGAKMLIGKKKEESWLDCLCANIYLGNLPSKVKPLYHLCEYYRLIRNNAVHNLSKENEIESQYFKLSLYDFSTNSKFAKLVAPNPYMAISFDDFIMFSRSCLELATMLYEDTKIDYYKVIESIQPFQICKWENQTTERMLNSIQMYMKTNYKIDESFYEVLPNLIQQVMTRSSNG